MRARPRIVVVDRPELATVAAGATATADHAWPRAGRVLLLRAELQTASAVDLSDISLTIIDDTGEPLFADTYGPRAVSFRALSKRPRRAAATTSQPSGLLMHRLVRRNSSWRISIANGSGTVPIAPIVYFLVEDL